LNPLDYHLWGNVIGVSQITSKTKIIAEMKETAAGDSLTAWGPDIQSCKGVVGV